MAIRQTRRDGVVSIVVLLILSERFAIFGVPVSLCILLLASGYFIVSAGVSYRVTPFLAVLLITVSALLSVLIEHESSYSIGSVALLLAIYGSMTLEPSQLRAPIFPAVEISGQILGGLALLQFISGYAHIVSHPDLLSYLVPGRFLIAGFNTTYPVTYGSSIFKSNGFLTLEPSFLSAICGLGLLYQFETRRLSILRTALLLIGLALSFTTSGIFAIVLGLLFTKFPVRTTLRALLPAGVAITLLYVSGFLPVFVGHVTEGIHGQTSTNLRLVAPVRILGPAIFRNVPIAVWGHGPGTADRFVARQGTGLQAPTIMKVAFEYGVLGLLAFSSLIRYAWRRTSAPRGSKAALFLVYLLTAGFLLSGVWPYLMVVAVWAGEGASGPLREMRVSHCGHVEQCYLPRPS